MMKLINPKEQIRLGAISTSRTELIDLIKAWAAISLAFGVLLSDSVFSFGFISVFTFASLSVGLGFIAHEMAHKIVAQRYGCQAEFRSWDQMLVLSIVMSFFGFVIAAPGAVFITGLVGKRRNGKISAAGAIANLAVAFIFLAILLLHIPGLNTLADYGIRINAWLALFNMIPFGMFDGKKVLAWNKLVYGIIIGASVGLLFILPIVLI